MNVFNCWKEKIFEFVSLPTSLECTRYPILAAEASIAFIHETFSYLQYSPDQNNEPDHPYDQSLQDSAEIDKLNGIK